MKKIRRLLCGVFVAAFLALAGPLWAQGGLDANELKSYAGTYSSACSNPAAPRLLVTANALIVESGGRRITGTNVESPSDYFGNRPPPPNSEGVLSSTVGTGSDGYQLVFELWSDRSGDYIVLQDAPIITKTSGKVLATSRFGKALLTPRYRLCGKSVPTATTKVAAQRQVASAPAQPAAPPVCGNQPFCTEDSGFAATITDFRAILQNTNTKTLTARMSFRNKLNRPLILGYVSNSAVATDDQNNRYSLSGQRAVQGMGQISGNSLDPKFILQPGESSDARFEFVWNSSGREIFGLTFQMDLAIREIELLPGNQFRLGREHAIHFSGLGNRGAAAGSLSRTAPGAQPALGNAVAAPPAASSQGDVCGGNPRCYSAGPFAAEVTGMTPSQGYQGYSLHAMQINVRFRNLTAQPIILAYVDGSGVITDNNGKRYERSGGTTGARGMGTVDGNQADPSFVLSPGASSNASFVFTRQHYANDPRDPMGTTFNFDLSIAQLEVLPSQQIRTVREYSVGFSDLGNSSGPAGSMSRAAGIAQPPGSGDAAAPSAAAPSQVDACSGKPRCFSAGPFTAEVLGMAGSQQYQGYSLHAMQINVRFRNLTAQPIILAYVDGSGVITDNNGKRYERSGGTTGARGMGKVDGNQADPSFVLSPGASSNASFVFTRQHYTNDPRDPIGTSFSFNLSVEQLEILSSQQVRSVREYSLDLPDLTAGGAAGAPPGQSLRDSWKQLKDSFKKKKN
jgi:hypothetical protein